MGGILDPSYPKDTPIDLVTGGKVITDSNHSQVHAGNAFSYAHNNGTGLAQSAAEYLTITVPSNVYPHWQEFEVTSDGANDLLVSFYDESILAATPGGTVLTPNNRNRAGLGRRASGLLTFTGAATNTHTVTIGTRVYTFQTVLVDAADNVLIGANVGESITNLVNAITLGGGTPGTHYGTATTINTDVWAYDGEGNTIGLVAKTRGTGGNAIATTETLTNASFGATTLTGGTADTKSRSSDLTLRLAPTITYIGYETFDNIALFKQGAVNSRAVGSKQDNVEWVMKAGKTFTVKILNNGSGAGTVRYSLRLFWYEEGGY